MAYFSKHFTVEEANALVPEIRAIFEEIHAEIAEIEAGGGTLMKTALESLPTNGGGPKVEAFFGLSHSIQHKLTQLHQMGIQVKDIQRGLVDFPAMREGEEILLCWLLVEPREEYWHDLETVFPGRQRIE